jgi:hypothetical protein
MQHRQQLPALVGPGRYPPLDACWFCVRDSCVVLLRAGAGVLRRGPAPNVRSTTVPLTPVRSRGRCTGWFPALPVSAVMTFVCRTVSAYVIVVLSLLYLSAFRVSTHSV